MEAVWPGWNSKIPNTLFVFCIILEYNKLYLLGRRPNLNSELIYFPYILCAHRLKVILLNIFSVVVSCLWPVTRGHMQDFSTYGIMQGFKTLSSRALWIYNISLEMISLFLPPQQSKSYALPSLGWVTITFSPLCPSTFHHCDKTPDEDKLKERKFIVTHAFQIQSMVS